MTTPFGTALLLLLLLVCVAAPAHAQVFRWVDDEGNVNYAGTRDQVPERYRFQLPPVEEPSEPTKPEPERPRRPRGRVEVECILNIAATPGRPEVARSYPSCAACLKAVAALPRADAARARCVAVAE